MCEKATVVANEYFTTQSHLRTSTQLSNYWVEQNSSQHGNKLLQW